MDHVISVRICVNIMTKFNPNSVVYAKQAVYTSARSPIGVDYHLVAVSSGLSGVSRKISKHSAAKNIYPPEGFTGLGVYKLNDELWGIWAKTVNGMDNTGRPRYYCHTIFLKEKDFEIFDYNPFRLETIIQKEIAKNKNKRVYSEKEHKSYPDLKLQLCDTEPNDIISNLYIHDDFDQSVFYELLFKINTSLNNNCQVIINPPRDKNKYGFLHVLLNAYINSITKESRKNHMFGTFFSHPFEGDSYNIQIVAKAPSNLTSLKSVVFLKPYKEEDDCSVIEKYLGWVTLTRYEQESRRNAIIRDALDRLSCSIKRLDENDENFNFEYSIKECLKSLFPYVNEIEHVREIWWNDIADQRELPLLEKGDESSRNLSDTISDMRLILKLLKNNENSEVLRLLKKIYPELHRLYIMCDDYDKID